MKPNKSLDGGDATKDVSDAVAAATYNCLENGIGRGRDLLNAANTVGVFYDTSNKFRKPDMRWVLPPEFRGYKIQVLVQRDDEEGGGDYVEI